MKTNLLTKATTETTSILTYIEEGEVLKFSGNSQHHDKVLTLENIEFGEVRFERLSDWRRLINKLERYNHDQLLNRFFKDSNKLELDNGVYIKLIDRINGTIQAIFENGQKIIVGETNTDYITFEASKIQGRLSWEWYFTGRNEIDCCDGLSVVLTDIQIID